MSSPSDPQITQIDADFCPAKKVALSNSVCHAGNVLSGIHDFDTLQPGFRPKISAGMTTCEYIKKGL
jgi:hypothetical protein